MSRTSWYCVMIGAVVVVLVSLVANVLVSVAAGVVAMLLAALAFDARARRRG